MLNLYDILHAFEFAMFGYCFSCVLTQEDKILERYGDFLITLQNKGLKWLADPLGLCEVCFTGQVALWVWLLFNYQDYKIDPVHTFVSHVLIIVFSINFVILIKKCLND